MPPEFGATRWGRSWTRIVETTAASGPNPMLPKARSIARNHGATLIAELGAVAAKVVVSGTEYTVQIDLPTWPDETKKEAELLILKSLGANSGLASGDLPDSLEGDLTAAGIRLAVPMSEQVTTCSCRTRKRPCVHILAALYALSMRIDERPLLAIELRMDSAAHAEAADTDWIPLTDLDPVAFYG